MSELAAFSGVRESQPEVANVLLTNLRLRALLVKMFHRPRFVRGQTSRRSSQAIQGILSFKGWQMSGVQGAAVLHAL
jgi:hypothetical protein